MGKKGALTAIFSRSRLAVDSPTAGGGSGSPPWTWPSCRDPQTDSFRAGEDPCTSTAGGGGSRCRPVAARHRKLAAAGEMYKTVNSVYLDRNDGEPRGGCLLDDEEVVEDEGVVLVDDDGCFSTTAASEEWSEAVIRSLGRTTSSTDRFFFDLQGPATTNSILASSSPARTPPPPAAAAAAAEEEDQKAAAAPSSDNEKLHPDAPCRAGTGSSGKSLVEESVTVAVAVDSADPYRDFRSSMEEMVAAHGLRGWDALEELLVWYLRVNAKFNHALIVGAFIDLLLGLAAATPSSTSTAATTTTTTTSTSSTSSSSASTNSTTSTTTSTATTSTSDGGGGVTSTATAAAAAATEQCGGGDKASASCSSSSSCVPSDQDEAGRGEDQSSTHHTHKTVE